MNRIKLTYPDSDCREIMRRKEIILQAVLVLTLLTSLLTGIQLVKAQSTTPSETTQTVPEPIVSFTQWHTSTPVIQTPVNRLADIQPIDEITSPQNQTIFQTSNVTVTIDVASYFWIIDSVYYQADWQEGIHQIFGIQPNYEDGLNATITATFTQIPLGNHSVEIYVNTHDDMHASSTVAFSTEGYLPLFSTPSPTLAAFSTPIVPEYQVPIMPLLLIIMAVAGSLVYFKKHKPNLTLQT